MAVNLVAPLTERRDGDALAAALRAAEAHGYRLAPLRRDDERLFAWIDATFAPSWWSSEARASDGWVAETASGEIAGFAAYGSAARDLAWLRSYRDRAEVGVFGPFGVAPAHRKTGVGVALLDAALASLARSVPQALIPAVAGDRLIAWYTERAGATVAETYAYPLPRARAVILASGSGTNAQAVIDAVAAGRIALDLHVVANAEGAFVRERAREAGIGETAVVWQRGVEKRAAFDARVIASVAACEPELVLLLGWMHLLPAAFLERFPQTLNVHPAFLPFDPTQDRVVMPDGTTIPAFRGAHSPEDTIAAGVGWSGASVHRVTAETDRGAIAVRTPLALAPGTTLDELRERLRPLEHGAVVTAIRRWGFERG